MNLFRRHRAASVEPGTAVAAPRTGSLARIKTATQGGVMLAVEAVGMGLSVIGTPLAALTGRVYIAVLVAAFGLGCALRFVRLRQRRRQPPALMPAAPQPTPLWVTPSVLLVSALEMAVLVEATRWPVRVDQIGFEPVNWLWVMAGFAVLVGLQRGWLLHRLRAARLHR